MGAKENLVISPQDITKNYARGHAGKEISVNFMGNSLHVSMHLILYHK
jgi:hypothetical protein